jgi:hypothetical protein
MRPARSFKDLFQEIYSDIDNGFDHSKYKLSSVSVSILPHQCGISFRESENHLLSTGSMPWLVEITGV